MKEANLKELNLKTGDVLVVKLGLDNLSGAPWLPTTSEIEETRELIESVIPKGVKVLVTHFGIEFEAIHTDLDALNKTATRFLEIMGEEV